MFLILSKASGFNIDEKTLLEIELKLSDINLKKSVESNPAKKIQHKLDNMFLSIDGI